MAESFVNPADQWQPLEGFSIVLYGGRERIEIVPCQIQYWSLGIDSHNGVTVHVRVQTRETSTTLTHGVSSAAFARFYEDLKGWPGDGSQGITFPDPELHEFPANHGFRLAIEPSSTGVWQVDCQVFHASGYHEPPYCTVLVNFLLDISNFDAKRQVAELLRHIRALAEN